MALQIDGFKLFGSAFVETLKCSPSLGQCAVPKNPKTRTSAFQHETNRPSAQINLMRNYPKYDHAYSLKSLNIDHKAVVHIRKFEITSGPYPVLLCVSFG